MDQPKEIYILLNIPQCNFGVWHEDKIVDTAIPYVPKSSIDQLTAQLAEWRKDAERLAGYHWMDTVMKTVAIAYFAGTIPEKVTISHSANCPITLHRQLVIKYGGQNE